MAAQYKAVIGLTDGPDSWPFVLSNLVNILAAYPPGGIDLELVAYGPRAISFVLATCPLAARIAELNERGVRFLGCGNTLAARQIPREALLPFVTVVPAGIVHLINRQEEGWSYVKGGF